MIGIDDVFAVGDIAASVKQRLLNVAREAWKNDLSGKRFYHVSTDEVYGSLHDDSLFLETCSSSVLSVSCRYGSG